MASPIRRDYYFVIVGHNDEPLFQQEFPIVAGSRTGTGEDTRHLSQFIAHASLDVLDEHAIQSSQMYFKNIDKFNEWFVSGFVTAGRMRFVMLHTAKNESGIEAFFKEVYELYIKLSMNPFFEADKPIEHDKFADKVITYGRKYLQ